MGRIRMVKHPSPAVADRLSVEPIAVGGAGEAGVELAGAGAAGLVVGHIQDELPAK